MKQKSDRALHMRETYKSKIREEAYREVCNWLEEDFRTSLASQNLSVYLDFLESIERFMSSKGIYPKGDTLSESLTETNRKPWER